MQEYVSNIDSAVTSVLNQMKEFGLGQKNYPWMLNIAIRGYSDKLRGFHMPSLVPVRFPVSLAVRDWSYPQDCMRVVKIVYRCYNGEKNYVLGLDPDMDISGSIATCEEPIDCCTQPQGGIWLADGWGGSGLGAQPMFAEGGGFAANYYRNDHENRRVHFYDNLPVGNCYIEYLSSGKNVGSYTLVPQAYRGTFEDYLKWQVCMLTPRLKSFANEFKTEHKSSLWDSNTLAKGLTVQETRDIINSASGFNVNR